MENINYDYTFLASTSFIRKAGVLCSFLIDTNFFNYDNKLDPVDMEKQLFDLELILDYETSLKMRCHFWSKKIPNLKIICRLIDKPKYYQYYYGAKIKDSYFSYKDKILGVSSSSLHLDIISTKYPFIYADEQDLDLNDGEDVYILKFRVGVYYDKNLFLRDTNMEDNFLIPLDNCLVINDEISCSITKEKIKTFAHRYSTLPRAYLGVESFDLEYRHERYVYASDIHIKFEDNIRRENVNVEIIKVIDKILGNGYFIVFETNVKNFPIFKSEPFNLNFTHSDTGRSEAHKCYFRKHEDTPLLILCESFTNSYSKGIYYTLDKIDKLNISNINVYHNFIISYSNIEIITPAMTYSRQYRYIYAVYPDILDFTSRDSLNITFISSIGSIKEVVLNPKSQALKCERNYEINRCIVPKSHFRGKKSGLYYIYHVVSSSKDIKVKNYELPPLKVILQDDGSDKESDEDSDERSDEKSDKGHDIINASNIYFLSYFLGIYLILILL